MSEHCRHCDRCRDVWLGAHTDAKGATWPDRCCPACAEAELLAEAADAARSEGAAAEREGIVDWLMRSADPGVRALADDVARLVP